MEPSLYKDARTKRGFTYHYLCVYAQQSKPTLLFLHGFPSTSYDWRHQIEYFKPKGYGLIVPDLLGYGGTDKPLEIKEFRMTAMAEDINDLLDKEGLGCVIGVGHDWGCSLLTRLWMLYSDRFTGVARLGMPFTAPQPEFALDAILEFNRRTVGYDVYGYWKFFRQDDAATKMERNIDSFMSLLYPREPETFKDILGFSSETQEWIEQDKRTERATYLTEEEYERTRADILKGGLSSPLNWYKSYLSDYNKEDHTALAKQTWIMKQPGFFGAALKDYVAPADRGKAAMEKHAMNLTMVDFDTGHWVQLEEPDMVNKELELWIQSFSAY